MSSAKLAPPAASAAVAMTTNDAVTAAATAKPNQQTTGSQSHQQRSYGKIVLTLENCLLPETKLDLTPSQVDGLDREMEIDLRILGCELIQTAGILLKLPQVNQKVVPSSVGLRISWC
ncbi:cyclin-L1-like isoform X2 [Armigeres subalbatus]|uniref:cyclin-L1-like isoform X2 n=1 Tax=Armigeres subalbatus TaxID=124917 RepID=UPI002ED5B3FE